MLTFGTLGPTGSNHEWVTKGYMACHRLSRAHLQLYDEFDQAFDDLLAGNIDHVIQVAVHVSVTKTVAKLRGRAHIIDAFVSPSQPMAVVNRTGVHHPQTLGLQLATRDYIDTSRWAELIAEPTTIEVANGLLARRYDSGITLAKFAEQYPDRLYIAEMIGTVVDPWLVYGSEPTVTDAPLIWPNSPAAKLFQRR